MTPATWSNSSEESMAVQRGNAKGVGLNLLLYYLWRASLHWKKYPGKHLECVRMSNRTVIVVLCNVIVSFVSCHGHVFFLV